jgi:hypothetical protein
VRSQPEQRSPITERVGRESLGSRRIKPRSTPIMSVFHAMGLLTDEAGLL